MSDEKFLETTEDEIKQEMIETAEETKQSASAISDNAEIPKEMTKEEAEPAQEEPTEEGLTEDEGELTDDLLCSYNIEYTEEERKLFWGVNSDPLFKRSNLIFVAVCFGLAILSFIWRKNFILPLALVVIGIVWAGVPALIYLIRYSRYKRKTKNLWLHKFHVDICEEHVDFNCLDDKEIGMQSFFYDDFYRIINMNNRLYLLAGMKKVIILPKQVVPREIIDAILELDIMIQTQPKM